MGWYDTGAPPPSLAEAKGSAHTRYSSLLWWWRRWWWWWCSSDLIFRFPWQRLTIIRGGASLASPATGSQTHTFKPCLIFKDLVLKVVDLALEEVDFLIEGEDDVLHGLAIHLEITGVVRDHEVIGIESMFHHPLVLCQAWGRFPGNVSPPLSFAFTYLNSIFSYL